MTSDIQLYDGSTASTGGSPHLSALDQKLIRNFPGLVVRKDLTNGLKQNAVVPTYVLEYLLGQHCATDDREVLEAGLQSVQRILAKHYVHRNQAELVKSVIKERGRHKVIDKVSMELNEKGGFYEAEFSNLGIWKVPLSDDYARRYPKLLVGGIWCIVDVSYEVAEDTKASPWQIEALKPIQVPGVDMDEFLRARAQFSTDEWLDVLMQSMGFNPDLFGRRAKLLTVLRLVPYCERNYNLLELGPKGTGKSHIYAEFSPHGMLISGAEITAPKLFVSNATGRIGLVGYWDCICFDEFAGKEKRVDKALVDIMKNYMANRSFSRGIEQLAGEASMVFMGNTQKTVPYMLRHSHFFEALPDKYIDSAFLDRLHAFSPGWEVSPVRQELFTGGYGFIVDYLAEVLKHQRSEDFTGAYKRDFEIASELSTRDQTGFEKTFSGLMKLIHPTGEATADEVEELLSFSLECRRRVREHLIRIDDTFKPHDFVYRSLQTGRSMDVRTLEELQYPELAGSASDSASEAEEELARMVSPAGTKGTSSRAQTAAQAQPRHLFIAENSKGWSYQRLLGLYLAGARLITIHDPNIRQLYQARNLMDFLKMVHDLVPEYDDVTVRLVTSPDPEARAEQEANLNRIVAAFTGSRIEFSWVFSDEAGIELRGVTTDTGWRIEIDRGLDIFQRYDDGPFSLEQAIQEARLCWAVEVVARRG